ncbi:MAG: hypothetical protein UX85_C0008G0017 [Candidatus Beckwithbacteria bacterium GW2011_GWB1_47_15]|uniref:Integral membrane protein n=1 Tax=Candidatus Beckwithbacteria bacterium GW2011_GWB1_47_15 TaxID=1618371 RepID=A0A0G1U2S7_9BACT|nr:MAG: Uncharacterized protein UY43_C0001G1146 [Candidatus Beckwithbacteria bacterium GW2011_GWC1_49_16]KKU34840.1 MAG: hypothetical protein UX50_C0010G0009 [Candidatus Beckwithbacteria bacterium GW2011_GWA1_46_30]KKU60643.1 MAG: hypothetical protein UX85_C0008G0017 [Candidatus Beckwithbacteria bacterium GW2011_GWB1_47_15]KKU72676.1 MAG: hypothetical protein UX97_C0001G0546 [Candidatus Beckwithbacteria bacterium GW2011_GWA2_47_25]KKW02878.1 MAG: hypothetical protein UY37_C0010G0016 [Candidatus
MAIVNKAIPKIGTQGDVAFARYLAIIWQVLVIVGGLAVLLNLIWGALDWILSGSNQERLKRAKEKMGNGIFGLAILVLSYLIIQLVSLFTGLDILNPPWPTL